MFASRGVANGQEYFGRVEGLRNKKQVHQQKCAQRAVGKFSGVGNDRRFRSCAGKRHRHSALGGESHSSTFENELDDSVGEYAESGEGLLIQKPVRREQTAADDSLAKVLKVVKKYGKCTVTCSPSGYFFKYGRRKGSRRGWPRGEKLSIEFLEDFLGEFSRAYVASHESFSERTLIVVFAWCGNACLENHGWLDKMAPALALRFARSELGPTCGMHIAVACGRMEYENSSLFNEMSRVLRYWLLRDCDLPFVVNVVWSCRKAKYFNGKFFQDCAMVARKWVGEMNEKDLEHLLGSFTKYLAFRVAQHKKHRKRSFEDDQVHEYVMERENLGSLFASFYSRAFVLENYDASSIGIVLWSLGSIRTSDFTLLRKLLPHVLRMCPSMDAKSLSLCAWCLYTLRFYNPEVMDAIAERGMQLLEEGATKDESEGGINEQSVSMCISSFGILNHHSEVSERFMKKLAIHATSVISLFSWRSLPMVMWGFAMFECIHPPFFEAVQKEMAQREMSETSTDIPLVDMSKFHQVQLYLKHVAPEVGTHIESGTFNELLGIMYQVGRKAHMDYSAWVQNLQSTELIITTFHKEVASVVHMLGFFYEMEHYAEYFIDVAILEHKIAIEADGPYHFTKNVLHADGPTMLKKRTLEGMGWKVVSVPFYDWHDLDTMKRKQEYIANKITALGVELPPKEKIEEGGKHNEVDVSSDVEKEVCMGLVDEPKDSGEVVDDATEIVNEDNVDNDDLVGNSEEEDGKKVPKEQVRQRKDLVAYRSGKLSKRQLLLNKAERSIQKGVDSLG